MPGQSALELMLGPARLRTYLDAANGDPVRTQELYLWVTDLAGALHSQISFVELAVRNAIDPQLAAWNAAEGFSKDWTANKQAAPLLYGLMKKPLPTARDWAHREANDRAAGHPRHAAGVSHDDVVAQLMFGAWVKLVRPISPKEPASRQQQLWKEVLWRAFPYADPTDSGRVATGNQLEAFRRLRNRVAHHDNLLEVDIRHRLNGMLSLLASISPDFPALAAARSALRRLAREDPRRTW